MKAFFNDELLEENDISISPNDLIVQRGVGIFDFFRIVSGKPLFIQEHLNRFIKSAEIAKIPLRWSYEKLEEMVNQLIAVNQKDSGGIKIILSGGVSPMGMEIISPNLIIIQNRAKSPAPEKYENGVNIITCDFMRELPSVKTINYFNSVWLHDELSKSNAIDVLYHHNGFLQELSRSNLFLVKDQVLITSETGVLAGITRSKVLEAAKNLFPLEVRDVKLEELEAADEVFISGTLKQVLPVVRVDGKTIRDGKPGSVTREIMRVFKELVQEELR
ncbi:MAG: aminotransferase class IV [Bacteroidota bacterium]